MSGRPLDQIEENFHSNLENLEIPPEGLEGVAVVNEFWTTLVIELPLLDPVKHWEIGVRSSFTKLCS